MKAERRHELKENDLVHALHDLRAYTQSHGQRLLLTGGGIVVIILLVWFIIRSSSQATMRDWARYTEIASTVETTGWSTGLNDLLDLGGKTKDSALAIRILGQCGQEGLRLAIEAKDDAEAKAFTDQAEQAFTLLRDQYGGTRALARGVAICGLATVAENRFALTGDAAQKDVAKRYLEQVANDPELNATPMKNQAITRLTTLDEVFKPVTFAPPLPKPEPPKVDGGTAGDPGAAANPDAAAKPDATAKPEAGAAPAAGGDAAAKPEKPTQNPPQPPP
ncbi:MAG: hypothetical protein IT449_04465 [Phycisphaerales bacterium]|nr:hypothetical protein [Phycisphaerales bacterium]